MKLVNLSLLASAISDLDHDYDTIDEHFRLQAATRERDDQFEIAVGNHPRKAELMRHIQKGDASKALEVARAIQAQPLFDAPQVAAAS